MNLHSNKYTQHGTSVTQATASQLTSELSDELSSSNFLLSLLLPPEGFVAACEALRLGT